MKLRTERVLVIDIRTQRFGFVLLESTGALLDWGISGYHAGVSDALRRKVTRVCDQYAPIRILVRRINIRGPHQGELLNSYFRLLQQEAVIRSVPMRVIDANAVRKHFQLRGRHNKHEIAELVAASFPELAWRLPNKRKPWQSEPASQVLFDAASVALLELSQESANNISL